MVRIRATLIALALTIVLAAISHAETAPEQHNRLADVGRVWGFLKYHHPGVMAGDADWDRALVDALEPLLASESPTAFESSVSRLIDRADAALGEPIRPASSPDLPDQATRINLDHRWLEAKSSRIPARHRARLMAVLACERPGVNHWVSQVPGVGNTTYQTEAAHYGEYPTPALRLLALFRFWNVMHYFFPYKYQIESGWDAILDEFVPRFLNAENALAYHLATLELTTRLEDSHAAARSTLLGAHFGNLLLPFELSRIDGQCVVTKTVTALSGRNGVRAGDVVTAIDGRSVERKLADLRPYAGASNERGKQLHMHRWLTRGGETEATVTVRRGDEEVRIDVERHPAAMIAQKMQEQLDPRIWYVREEDGIGYVDMARFRKEDIDAAMKELGETPAIIFDMRAYPDFLLYQLLPHLSPESTPFARFTAPIIQRPGVFVETPPVSVGPASRHDAYYRGKVVVLVDETTISRAEFVTMALQTAPNTTVIGAQTAGADGNVSTLKLPGGILTSFTGIGVYYPDGGKTQRVGIRIDIDSAPTIDGLRAGNDDVLDRAVRFIKTGE